jgi:hypothetical protein
VAGKSRGVPRRFVPGNTAFRSMRGLPILKLEDMITVGVDERERVFRTIIPSEKFNPRLGGASKGNVEDEDEEMDEPDEPDPDAGGMGLNKSGKVPLFYMELHPKARQTRTNPDSNQIRNRTKWRDTGAMRQRVGSRAVLEHVGVLWLQHLSVCTRYEN